jgi:hypothetical protein
MTPEQRSDAARRLRGRAGIAKKPDLLMLAG